MKMRFYYALYKKIKQLIAFFFLQIYKFWYI